MTPASERGATPDYDVIIVGGRVAGSVLATLLGQARQRVLLLDKAHFPSDTLSTHFFRSPALRVLDRIGVLDEVRASAPPMTAQWTYIDGHVMQDTVEETDARLRYYLCVRRITLDWILHRRVKAEAGVEVRQGARVKEVIREDGIVTGVRWTEADGGGEARARAVVGADGFYSTMAHALDPEVEAGSPVQRCMYYTYVNGLALLDGGSLAEHHFVGDSLTYVFPTDAGLTMTAISLPISEFASFKKNPLERMKAHLGSLPMLAERFRRAEVAADVKGSGNIPCYQRAPYGQGWALAGDAHQVMDPWSGQGIDHATTHAAMLAEELESHLTGKADWGTAMSEYRSRARRWSEKTYRRTSTYAADLRPMTRAALERRGLAQAL